MNEEKLGVGSELDLTVFAGAVAATAFGATTFSDAVFAAAGFLIGVVLRAGAGVVLETVLAVFFIVLVDSHSKNQSALKAPTER